MEIAIVAVAYNRIDSLSRLLGSLDNAYYNDCAPTLIISVDKSKTDAVERFAEEYNWEHGEKIVDKHEKNLGLRPHMMSLGKWFDRFDALVVLEDDIVVSPNFFYYTEQTVSKYSDKPNIAGISLYSIAINYQTALPFDPVKDEHDAYFMNCAMSWGEVWMRDSWMRFYDWYLQHQDFPVIPHLPHCICMWNEKSWLKYHIRYCIEENKFFVHPYISLTTNYSDAGEHSAGSTVFQVAVQRGNKTQYNLPESDDTAVYYDGFFENKSIYDVFKMNDKELCVDLQGEWRNRMKKRYWLTTEKADYKVVQSFGLNYRPLEMNVILKNPGEGIFLYDTTVVNKNYFKNSRKSLLFRYHLSNIFYFIRQYGFANTWRDFMEAIKIKFNLK